MLPKVLLLHDNRELLERLSPLDDQFTFISAAELSADLDSTPNNSHRFDVVIHSFIDHNHEPFTFPPHIPPDSLGTQVLFSTEEQLSQSLDYGNKQSFFRHITDNTSTDTLKQTLLDACTQTALVKSVHKLKEKIRLLKRADPVTACPNRQYGFETLQKNLSRAKRYAQYLSVMLCTIDNLHEIRNSHGHSVANSVLKAFSQYCTNELRRDIDMTVRWNEDTFLVMLPETGIRGAGKAAERLRSGFASLQLDIDNIAIKGTLSMGSTCYAPEYPDRNDSADMLVLLAERCLAQAQSAGGDTVLCCP